MSNAHLNPVVLIRGAGEMASGIAYSVHMNNFRVCLTEVPQPLAVSRSNSFSDAVLDGTKSVCDVTAEMISMNKSEIERVWERGNIPLVIDPEALVKKLLSPDILIDAIMAKKPTGTKLIEIDPVYDEDVFGLIRDKIWIVGRAVIKAVERKSNSVES